MWNTLDVSEKGPAFGVILPSIKTRHTAETMSRKPSSSWNSQEKSWNTDMLTLQHCEPPLFKFDDLMRCILRVNRNGSKQALTYTIALLCIISVIKKKKKNSYPGIGLG